MSEVPVREARRGLRGRTLEGLTIVVSILLALLADAAWGYRSDRADERELLDALTIEFVGAAEELEGDLEAREDILRQTDVLLRARVDPAARPSPESVPALLFSVRDWRFYTPSHAVLDDALGAGRLQLIRSTEVRQAIMSYQRARERLVVLEELERDFVADELEPFLAARVALDRLHEEAPQDLQRAEAVRLLTLLSDDEFGSLLRLRWDRTEAAIRFEEGVQRAVARVREALEGG